MGNGKLSLTALVGYRLGIVRGRGTRLFVLGVIQRADIAILNLVLIYINLQLYAQDLAIQKKVPLVVVFNLVPKFHEATQRQYGFMLKGLALVESELRTKHIPFYLSLGSPVVNIPRMAADLTAFAVVCDFSPLRTPTAWCNTVAVTLDTMNIPLFQVDAHNVVPCWVASTKQEVMYGVLMTSLTLLLRC